MRIKHKNTKIFSLAETKKNIKRAQTKFRHVILQQFIVDGHKA
jgi:hypothetical protein